MTAATEGTPVFDQPGIDLDRDLDWIHRDQYVYFIEMAHHLGNPTDWASFRGDLADALSAAFSLDRTPPWADRRSSEDLRTRQRVLDVLDSIRFRHHPAGDWDGFFDALWERRRSYDTTYNSCWRDAPSEHLSVRYRAHRGV